MHQPRSSKLPNSFTLEELLDSANTPTSESELVPSNDITDSDVFTFINALKILPGAKKVQKRLLYTIYRNWSTEPVTKVSFSNFIQMFFEFDQLHYKLSLDALELLRIPFKVIRKIKQDGTKSKSRKQHFEAFLSFYKLAPGSFYVETGILYYLYDKWTYNNNNKRPMSLKVFFKFLGIYFEKKRLLSSKVSFFGINIAGSNVTQEEFITAQKWARKYHEKKSKVYKKSIKRKDKRWDKEEKDNEIQSEVPSIEPEGKP